MGFTTAFARALFLTVFLALPFKSFAAPLNELYEELRGSGVDYEIVGTVCEQVASLELRKTYPPSDYQIVTGIEYGDNQRTIGELDVVVFEKRSKQAVLVGEVKCWKDLSAARQKALDQRQRFQSSLKRAIELHDYEFEYNKAQFQNVQRYVAIAPKGAKAAGFEMDLENTLAELMQLRKMMMDCQRQGQCAAATRGH